jgi:hypothetical protein
MIPKIFPRNLTARAAMQVTGNPVNTRLESGVGNCFPGLEFDHRNLDRRFFPGLVFEFTGNGAKLLQVAPEDSDLDQRSPLGKKLAGDVGKQLSQGDWFLEEITQGGKAIAVPQDSQILDLEMVSWRLVRCLQPGPVKIRLRRRTNNDRRDTGAAVELDGERRSYVDRQSGVFSAAYTPGELTQSLCSPWMHDFRDCACYYWASNHPDIVLPEDLPGQPTLPSGAPDDPARALTPVDWLRSDRASTKPAEAEDSLNRPDQMDHYEINQRWQDLAIVLQGREISSIYNPREPEPANPLGTPDDLAAKLAELATLEHAVALEYLYARYSLKNPDDVDDKTLKEDLVFARHEILLIAVSEMRHLRWDNQLIWTLEHNQMLTKRLGPSLGVAEQIPVAQDPSRPPQLPPIPGPGKTRPRQLRPLEPETLQDFISVEQPSGFLDGQYSRVLATLREPKYPVNLEQLAARIVADGIEHFSRFREIQVVLRKYKNTSDYLRPVQPAPENNAEGQAAMQIYHQILQELQAAYERGDMEDAAHIATARALMFELDHDAEKMAARKLGIPFFAEPTPAAVRKRKPAGRR